MYAKVFTQIYDGTLCNKGPWQALVTFQQLLILADKEGVVDMTASAIARRTTIPLDIITIGLNALLQPDPESRTPTEGGRRIVPLSNARNWGWKIVNYLKYRSIRREEDRREYHKDYWNEKRSKKAKVLILKETPAKLNTTQHTQPNQPIAEAEAKAYANTEKENTEGMQGETAQAPLSPSAPGFVLEIDPPVKEKEPKPKKKTPIVEVIMPLVLDTTEFRKVWGEWEQHRKEIKHPLKPTSIKQQLNKLQEWGVDRAITALKHSMLQGWQGIFEPDRGNGQLGSKHGAKSQRMYPGEKPPQIAPAEKI